MTNGRRNGERVLGSGHLIGLFLGVVLLCCVFYTLGYVMGRSQEASTVRAATVEDSGTTTAPAYSPPPNVAASGDADTTAGTEAPATGGPAAPATGDEWNFSPKNANNTMAAPSETGHAAPNALAPSAPAQPANSRPAAAKVSGPPGRPDENLNTPSPSAPAITATPATMVRTPVSSATAGASGRVILPPNYQPPRIPRGAVLLQVAAMTSESDALALASVLHKKQFPAFVVTPTVDDFYRVQVGPYSDAHAAKMVRGMLDQAGFKSIIKH
jgi:cell division septation protein DedD